MLLPFVIAGASADWDYGGTFFTEKEAIEESKKAVESYGYEGLPINVSIEVYTIAEVKKKPLKAEELIIGGLSF